MNVVARVTGQHLLKSTRSARSVYDDHVLDVWVGLRLYTVDCPL